LAPHRKGLSSKGWPLSTKGRLISGEGVGGQIEML
jgi:hypothetical protein